MDVIRTLSVLCSAVTLSLLVTGCSHTPAKTAAAPPKSVYDTPKTLVKPESADPENTRPVLAIPATTAPNAGTATSALSESPAAKSPVPAATTSSTTPVTAPKPVVMPTPTPAKPASVAATPATRAPALKPAAPVQSANAKPPVTSPKPNSVPVTTTPAASKPAPETSVAMITPPTVAPAPVMETLKVTLDNMPLNIRGEWILDRTETQCLLTTAPLKMEDGQGGTPVTLQIAPGSFTILTRSDIDLSYTGTGLFIDDKRPFSLETVERRTNLSFNKQRQAILDSMRSGRELKLTLGFWPSWPVTHTYSLSIPLTHFATAINAWDTCNQLLSRK